MLISEYYWLGGVCHSLFNLPAEKGFILGLLPLGGWCAVVEAAQKKVGSLDTAELAYCGIDG